MRRLLLLPALALIAAQPAPPAKPKTPTDVIAASKPAEWAEIPAEELMVIDLASGKRVVVQLAPAFAPVHVANIQKLARAGYWQGAAIYRVQDNYVAQWGNNESEKPLPAGIVPTPPAEYHRALKGLKIVPLGSPTRSIRPVWKVPPKNARKTRRAIQRRRRSPCPYSARSCR